MSTDQNTLQIYTYPSTTPKSKEFRVRTNGQLLFVHHTNVADFSCLAFKGALEVEVEINQPITKVDIRPLSLGLKARIQGKTLYFTLTKPVNIQIDINGLKPLHFHGNPFETNIPSHTDPNVLWFKGGEVHEVGELVLRENQTLYIQGGAVLKGVIRASQSKNIKICGRGILDGSNYKSGNFLPSVIFDRCDGILIEDITIIEPAGWMVVLGASKNIHIRNLKEIGEIMCSDGIDIVGSRDVLIEGCFLKNNDDCIVIKADLKEGTGWTKEAEPGLDWRGNIENIMVKDCTLMNDYCGNAMEIGYELNTDIIRNVTYRNIDVIHVHGQGAVFSIHHAGCAAVSDILWEDIRIEHCYDFFIDFRIFTSLAYIKEKVNEGVRGTVQHIRLRNIHWHRTVYNSYCTKSIIGGWGKEHPIQDVEIDGCFFDGQRVLDMDRLGIYTKSVTGILLK